MPETPSEFSPKLTKITLPGQIQVRGVSSEIPDRVVATELGLQPGDFQMVLTVIGDAKYQNDEQGRRMDSLITNTLLRLAGHGNKLAVVCAATTEGVMGAVGKARHELHTSSDNAQNFTLIGCVPETIETTATDTLSQDASHVVVTTFDDTVAVAYKRKMVDEGTTHINTYSPANERDVELTYLKKRAEFLAPTAWDEANRRIGTLASYLSAAPNIRKVSILIGGGRGSAFEIVRKIDRGERIIVIEASGRLADALPRSHQTKTPPSADEANAAFLFGVQIGRADANGEITKEILDAKPEFFNPSLYDTSEEASDALVSLLQQPYNQESMR